MVYFALVVSVKTPQNLRCHLAGGLSDRRPRGSFGEIPGLLEVQRQREEMTRDVTYFPYTFCAARSLREARWSFQGPLADPGGSFAAPGVARILHCRTRLKNAEKCPSQNLHQRISRWNMVNLHEVNEVIDGYIEGERHSSIALDFPAYGSKITLKIILILTSPFRPKALDRFWPCMWMDDVGHVG